ncbi:uncharacterized protein zgc:174863 isoform X2 [Pimephales promelas]|uniref:uncharacterized protein zgc:174863 isoform X2 n=1 Tax=Pimephales promelas TaxID=90988 RepID=UPI0019557B36|nr:uncharacterized protein zgc:174863 isoform X2 [Pimephales promelas]
MSSLMVMVLVIISLVIPAVRPSEDSWTLKCLSTVGIVDQKTVIKCNFINIQDIKIETVSLKRTTHKEPIFKYFKTYSGDPRFSLENSTSGPSLQISKTKFADEGEYQYRVVTNRGEKKVQLGITITANYKNLTSSTWPKDVTDGGPADLYCNATDGYPAGFIHWFDRSGTNWTMNSELTNVYKDTNGLKSVALSSKLTFRSINLELGPFRCIVLNSKYVQEEEMTLHLPSAYTESSVTSNTTHIVAGVMVIGSLIVGLLCALLIFRKKNVQRYDDSGNNAEDDLESGYKLPLSADEIETKP